VGPPLVEVLLAGVLGTVLLLLAGVLGPAGAAVRVTVWTAAGPPEVHDESASAASAKMPSAIALRCFVVIGQAVVLTRPPVRQLSHGTFQSP
jgi:hypothetical protein